MPTLKELYDKWNFPNGNDPKAIDTKVPSILSTDIKQVTNLIKKSPSIYGTDIVRITSGGQVDKGKVRGVVGKIAGNSKLGGFIKKLVAPTAYKPDDLIADGHTIEPLYAGVEQGSSFGGTILKSVKQFLKGNKTPNQISGNALGAGVDLAQKGLNVLGNKLLGKLGIGKTDPGDPIDVRKPSNKYINQKSLIFPSTIVIHQDKNVDGVVGNQEQNYFVDGININNVFSKRITIGNNLKSNITDTEIGIESNKEFTSNSYFQKPTQYTFGNGGYAEIAETTTYSAFIKNDKYKGTNNNTNSKLLVTQNTFNHNIRNQFLSINNSNANDVYVKPKKAKLSSYFPLIGTLDGKAPEVTQTVKSDIYGTTSAGTNTFDKTLLESASVVNQTYFGTTNLPAPEANRQGPLTSTPELTTGSFKYTNNKDIYEGDSQTIGDVEKKISRTKVLRQTYKTLQPTAVNLSLPKYDSKAEAFINKSKQSIISKAPQNLNVVVAGIPFPSTITDFQDSLTPNWDSINPVGAGVPFYIFNNIEREISFKMTLYAENANDVKAIKQKYNKVGQAAWSRRGKYGAYGNITTLVIGNLIAQTGFISAWTLNIDTMHPWDTTAELPMVVNIDISFKVATNIDDETYNLYGLNDKPKVENATPPGAEVGKTRSTIDPEYKALKTEKEKSDYLFFKDKPKAVSDTTRNVPAEQLKNDLENGSKGKKKIGG